MPVTEMEFRTCYSLREKLPLPHELMLGLLRPLGVSTFPVCEPDPS